MFMHISNVGKLKREWGKNLPVSPDPKGLIGLKWFKPIWSKNIINLQNVTYRRYSKSDWDENLKYNNHIDREGSLMSCSLIQIIFNRIHN